MNEITRIVWSGSGATLDLLTALDRRFGAGAAGLVGRLDFETGFVCQCERHVLLCLFVGQGREQIKDGYQRFADLARGFLGRHPRKLTVLAAVSIPALVARAVIPL